MLVSVNVRNFRSVKDSQTISFDAINDKRQDDTRLIPVDEKHSLIKTMAIIGPNGAGKSTMVRALETIKNIVTSTEEEQNPLKSLIGGSYAYGETKGMPSVITVDFITRKANYRYRIIADMNRIFAETLYKRIDGMFKMMYSRKFKEATGGYRCTFGKFYDYEVRREITRKLGNNKTVLQKGAMFGGLEMFEDVYKWFTDVLDIKPIGFATGSETFLVNMLKEHPDWSKKLVNFLWACDITDIKDIGVQNDHPVFVHSNVSAKYGSFFSGESLSLRRLVTVAASIFESYTKDKIMIFDDFGMMLHPNVVQHAARIFEKSGNTGRSQMIIVDCNPSLLEDGLLRRDGIYFAEKTAERTTHYYSLGDFKYSAGKLNTQVDYLTGAYGALPIMSSFKF